MYRYIDVICRWVTSFKTNTNTTATNTITSYSFKMFTNDDILT